MTPHGLQALSCKGDTLNAIIKTARRLGYRGWLETHRLPGGGIYYVRPAARREPSASRNAAARG